ncbi:MAG: metallophosphoesterase family protein, partial [Kiritimatiellae bacterium]|nr:metallophosphoesterase family protein [Kiritimatiellia bacterium]
MRYAIVSDIHANMAAWRNVLTDIADLRTDKIICLGDILGYGPDSVEVLESVYQLVDVTLQGNHDAAICRRMATESFSGLAADAVSQNRDKLAPAALQWLSALPLTHDEPDFKCAHGDFSDPPAFRYIIEPSEALPSWQATAEQLLFVGHSHVPGIFVIGGSGTPH